MLKSEYEKLIRDKPWTEMSDYFNGQKEARVEKISRINIDPEEWIQFSIDNFDEAQQRWEYPKDHFTANERKWAEVNNRLGRNKDNSFELNYGINGDTNTKLKELLGAENIKTLKAVPDTVLIRMLVKMPGHGVAWHQDGNNAYKKMFPDVDHARLKRYWFSVQDWQDGHVFQISKTMLSHWNSGDVYQIPFGVGHASANFGYSPQYTVSFTAIIED